jgi:hypothetical protein
MVWQQHHIAEPIRQIQKCEYDNNIRFNCVATPVGPPSPPELTGGVLVFPRNARRVFSLPQNSVTLTFNWLKLRPYNPQTWKRLRRIFAMLAKERKEAKEALWKFLRLDEIDKEVVVQPKVQRLRENLVEKEKTRRKFTEKPPPDLSCIAWLLGVVPALSRAPSNAALWRCVGG